MFATSAELNSSTVVPYYYLHLDPLSLKDREVIITEKAVVRLISKGAIISRRVDAAGEKPAELSVIWKRHRVPYDETGRTVALLEAHGGVDAEPFLGVQRRTNRRRRQLDSLA